MAGECVMCVADGEEVVHGRSSVGNEVCGKQCGQINSIEGFFFFV